jgi:hypothetical protein
VQSAALRLQENGDVGSGTLRVHRGSHNNWTETTLSSANAPVENGQLGTFTGVVGSGQVVSLNVTPLVTGNGTYSVIVKMDAGGNDVWFGSEESARKPRLIVETTSDATITQTMAMDNNSGSEVAVIPVGTNQDPMIAAEVELREEGIAIEHQVPPQQPRIRFTWVSPTELELGWQVADEAIYQVEIRTSLSEGAWTTLLSTAGSSGTHNIPISLGSTNAFFRVLRVE